MGYAVLFPGQGSQHVGMGAELFDEDDGLLGQTSDRVLGWSLRELCLEGPEDRLTETEYAQPAIYAVSYALWERASSHLGGLPSAGAGHSLGEYTALAAASALDYEKGLEIVAERGAAMAAAAAEEPSGMAAIIGSSHEEVASIVSELVRDGRRIEVANLNSPGQVVVAGAGPDLDWLVSEAKSMGLRRVIPLKVSGGFHSTFMGSAEQAVASVLESVPFSKPEFPVWSNVTARPHEDGETAELLARQVTSTVRFQETLEGLGEAGVDAFVHVGPGDATAAMASRTVPRSRVFSVSDPSQVPGVASALVTMAGNA